LLLDALDGDDAREFEIDDDDDDDDDDELDLTSSNVVL